jgi:hypothetical protein
MWRDVFIHVINGAAIQSDAGFFFLAIRELLVIQRLP